MTTTTDDDPLRLVLLSVEEYRRRGNDAFRDGRHREALGWYDGAVETCRSETSSSDGDESALTTHLCNRSACRLRLDDAEGAREDAVEAVSTSRGRDAKALFRLARACEECRRFDEAEATIQRALALPSLEEDQRREFRRLTESVKRRREKQEVSVREFDLGRTLGEGNFSRVVLCTHRATQKTYALKIINKAEAEKLGKRQHPNVFNEIKMERRVLCDRLRPSKDTGKCHDHLVTCRHAFQDYENLYFLVDHCCNGDLWSRTFHTHAYADYLPKRSMVGCHPSLIPSYVYQILSAVEHLHSHGIVHRDLKPENILLDERDRPIVIDFGTAKDLVQTDLNGPEFVGTPDFMTPEAVNGDRVGVAASSFEADLWTLGAVTYHLFTGQTPFASASPYLTFLRIARGRPKRRTSLRREDEAWDFIARLMRVDPGERLGAGAFALTEGRIVANNGGYDAVRRHVFLRSVHDDPVGELRTVPSLVDLATRACADMVRADADDLDAPDPGDGADRDVTRLSPKLADRLAHVLDRARSLRSPRVRRRLRANRADARLDRVRPWSRDVAGLALEDHPRPSEADARFPQDAAPPTTSTLCLLTSPLFATNDAADDDDVADLKECVRRVNRLRPDVVVACGRGCRVNARARKLLARVNESVHVVAHDDPSSYFVVCPTRSTRILCLRGATDDDDDEYDEWREEELEQARVGRTPTFCVADRDLNDADPRARRLEANLARSRVKCLLGTGPAPCAEDVFDLRDKTQLGERSLKEKGEDEELDDFEPHRMARWQTGDAALRIITVEEEDGTWEARTETFARESNNAT